MRFLLAAILVLLAQPARADPAHCDSSIIRISPSASDHADLICQAALQAKQLFERCNLPLPAIPVRIEIVEKLQTGCLAQYHCGEDWIEVLAPPVMQTNRQPDGAFAFLPVEDFFRSVLVHELTHAAFDTVPCPFAACVAAAEYVSYVMQVMSLTPAAQAAFVQNAGLRGQVSRDAFSPVMLFMAPNRFAQKAWVHFTQRDDPCGFIGQITDGTVLLDHERF